MENRLLYMKSSILVRDRPSLVLTPCSVGDIRLFGSS